jgi:hypothetical protein
MNRRSVRSTRRPARTPRRAQRGVSLIEGLISILLVSIVGLGLAFITTRAITIQGLTTSEAEILLGLRNALVNDGGAVTVAGRELSVVRAEEDLGLTFTIGGLTQRIDLPAESLSVTDTGLIRGDGSLVLDY